MNKQLLNITEESNSAEDQGLTIKKRVVKGADFSFDFSTKKLEATLNDRNDKVSTYILNKGLVNAVNAAIITGRPLLLKGEPGCGKTKLAKAVASYFYKDELSKYYFEWHVKSKSNAKEGGYTFDHVSRLRDATITDKDDDDNIKAKNPINYISLGPMGRAFVCNPPKGNLPILLIDEIDKGDIDFPNDLLLELDEMRFAIKELNQKDKFITAPPENRPLVFITSNDERELPPAFLRRCLYYRIPPFKQGLLEKIANSKLEGFYEELDFKIESTDQISKEDIAAIVTKFLTIKRSAASTKPPSTSELLDWLKVILFQINAEGKKVTEIIEDKELQQLALKLIN